MTIKTRITNLEKNLFSSKEEDKTIWVWRDPVTDELRNDEPPEEIKNSKDWLKIIVKPD